MDYFFKCSTSFYNLPIKNMSLFRKLLLPLTTIYNPGTAKDIKRIIKAEKIDVIHVHNTLCLVSPSVYYAALRMKKPVVQTVHNFRLLCPGATFYRDGKICEDCVTKGLSCALKNKCYRDSFFQTFICVLNTKIHRMTGIYRKINYICLTDFNKKKLLQLKGIDEGNVYVKPNFTIDYGIEKTSNDFFVLLGRVEKIKGIDLVISAFKEMPDKQLIVVGTGPELENYIQNNCLNNVLFTGYKNRNDINHLLSKAKAVIVASQQYEQLPMTIIEAYAAHIPVIAGDIGNIGILVENGITGITFEYHSVKGLINAIKNFDRKENICLSHNAYEKYRKSYSVDTNYKLLKRIYDQAGQ